MILATLLFLYLIGYAAHVLWGVCGITVITMVNYKQNTDSEYYSEAYAEHIKDEGLSVVIGGWLIGCVLVVPVLLFYPVYWISKGLAFLCGVMKKPA